MVAPDDKSIYVTSRITDEIFQFDAVSGLRLGMWKGPDCVGPTGITLNKRRDRLFVACSGYRGPLSEESDDIPNDAEAVIISLSLDVKRHRVHVSEEPLIVRPFGLRFDSDENLFVSNYMYVLPVHVCV